MNRFLKFFVNKLELKSFVVLLCIGGALSVAVIDKEQRNAFMTIAITATGGFFGAEVPSGTRARIKKDEEELEELKEHNGNTIK